MILQFFLAILFSFLVCPLSLDATLSHRVVVPLKVQPATTSQKNDSSGPHEGQKESKAIAVQGVPFKTTLFNGENFFYLGASDQGTSGKFALARAFVGVNDQTGKPAVSVVSMAQEKVYLNGSKEEQLNPLNNTAISLLDSLSPYPILTFDNGITDTQSNQLICLVEDFIYGRRVLTHSGTFLNDADGVPTGGIVGLVGSSFSPQYGDSGNCIFAAVRPNNANWGQSHSGIAVLNKTANALVPTDAQNGGDGNVAASLSPSNFTISGSLVVDAQPVAMHWDPILGRLYVGLQVRRGNTNTGGGIALLVGHMNGKQLVLQPFVPALLANFSSNSTLYPIGFQASTGTQDITTSIYHLKTMHTTTGRSYLILNGGTYAPGNNVKNQIYALPLLDNFYAAAQKPAIAIASNDIGRGAGNTYDTANTLVNDAAHMTLSTSPAAQVGGGPLPIESNQPVEKIFVAGNAVFACIAQDRSNANREAGIFQSQAVFDAHGAVRSWTPWRRVMGSVDPVFGAGIDIFKGNYWYLTNDNLGQKTVIKVTQWGNGENEPGLLGGNQGNASVGFSGVLASQFVPAQGGVHQLFDFGPETPGFAPITSAFAQGQFSMMVAAGLGTIALIQTGGLTGNVFTPTKGDFSINLSQNIGTPLAGLVQVFSQGALAELGAISSVECSRIPAPGNGNKGWLFVAGKGGLAVLSDEDGSGWDTQVTGLTKGFQGITSNFKFKRIGSFTDVKKIVCDGQGNLYVLALKGLFRISLDPAKFSENPSSLNEQLISTPYGVTGFDDFFLDFALVGSNGILATTRGLFTLAPGKDIAAIISTLPGNNWVEVQIPTAKGSDTLRSLDVVTSMTFLKDAQGTGGNLFVVAGDISLNVAVVYLFDVQANTVTLVNSVTDVQYFFSAGEFRSSFFPQGALGYHLRAKHYGNIDFLKAAPFLANPLAMRTSQNVISIGADVINALNCGVLTYNSASGALVMPLDKGIKFNE